MIGCQRVAVGTVNAKKTGEGIKNKKKSLTWHNNKCWGYVTVYNY